MRNLLKIGNDMLKIGNMILHIDGPEDIGLIYLTYFDQNNSTMMDAPVVQDPIIPLMSASNSYAGISRRGFSELYTFNTMPTLVPGLPAQDFNDQTFLQLRTNTEEGSSGWEDRALRAWNLPFTGSDVFSISFRVYLNTEGIIQARYSDPVDWDYYWMTPKVFFEAKSGVYDNHIGVADYDSERYLRTILLTNYPTVAKTTYNTTSLKHFKDRTFDDETPWPPAGREFDSFANSSSRISNRGTGDQWYQVCICCHGDRRLDTYVNGYRVIGTYMDSIKNLNLALDPKDYNTSSGSIYGDVKYVQIKVGGWLWITEMAVWNKDLSATYNYEYVPVADRAIYIKDRGIYVMNPSFQWRDPRQ